ncbi:MAG: hypothetical protein AAF682_31615 [Planctomycetota bacterium]
MSLAFLLATTIAAPALPYPAGGQETVLEPTLRGHVGPTGQAVFSAINNYFAGQCGTCSTPGEYRNYFAFHLGGLNGKVVSAQLEFDAADVIVGQSPPTSTYTVFAWGGAVPPAGVGVEYGSRAYAEADTKTLTTIPLNAAALQELNEASIFRFGGRFSDPEVQFGGEFPNECAFGSTGAGFATRLRVVTEECPVGPATEVARLGSPPNPDALLPGQTSGPVAGSVWDPVIDHTSFLPAATLDVLAVALQPANVGLGAVGTLLCDPATTVLVDPGVPGLPFAVPIPDDCGLVGATLCSQGASVDAAGAIRLTNALDLTLGS